MTKEEFKFHLHGASLGAIKLAEDYIKNRLSFNIDYHLILNVSTDDPKLKNFDVYPDDKDIIYNNLSSNEVVDILYRKGKVPVWIDFNVKSSSRNKTTLRLSCAGRYSNDKEQFYYNGNGSGPFGIKSPNLPFNLKEGKKFKL